MQYCWQESTLTFKGINSFLYTRAEMIWREIIRQSIFFLSYLSNKNTQHFTLN